MQVTKRNIQKCVSVGSAAVLALLFGCGSADDDSGLGFGPGDGTDDGAGDNDGNGAPKGGSGGSSAGSGGAAAPEPAPPEVEEQVDLEVPRAGGRYVFAANPRRDTVAVIDSTSLAIRTVQVGDKPAFLATVPGQDVALVINAGSADASIIRSTPAGSAVSTVPVSPGANRLSVASNGAHALAWYDSRVDGGLGGITGSYQDVTLIRLLPTGDVAIPLTVGFRPSGVIFSNDSAAAFVITEDGVSVIRFAQVTGPTLLPLVPLADAAAADVSITPDGKFALSRKEGGSVVSMVDLTTGVAAAADLGSQITDLDLTPNGGAVVAVLREAGQMITLPLPQGFADATLRVVQTFANETVGSAVIAPDGLSAFLYTTVGEVKRALVASLDGSVPARAVVLRKTVRAVAIAPNSQVAMVVHNKTAGDPKQVGIEEQLKIDRSFGYSVVSLATGFAKLQLTDADPGPLAIVPDSSFGFLLLRDDAKDLRVAQRINFQSFLVDDFVMGSPPVSIAVLASSNRVFVSQVHPAGRLSFIDWTTSAVASVTGFELNGGIRE